MKRILPSTSLGASLVALVVASMLLSACADTAQKGSVSVLYAGSLATVMENGVGPAFAAATGYQYKGEAHGSLGAARLIHDHLRSPDVFVSADPSVNVNVLMGQKNGDLVTWFVTLASSQLVLAYNPKSHFARCLRRRIRRKLSTRSDCRFRRSGVPSRVKRPGCVFRP